MIAPFLLFSEMRFLFFFMALPFALQAQKVLISKDAFAQTGLPISINIKHPGNGRYALLDPISKKSYPLQWANQQQAWFILNDAPQSLEPREMTLIKIEPTQPAINFLQTEKGIMARSGDKNIFFYQAATAYPPPDSPVNYQRSGFIHPLYSPAGKIMTDDFPASHAHQHAIFHNWANARFRNSHVDFWNQHRNEGTVKHIGTDQTFAGPVYGELTTNQEYISLAHGAVLQEKWTIRCYALTNNFMFDIHVEQVNITKDTLFLDQYIYGGMAFRGTKNWDPLNVKFFQNPWNVLTSEGLKDSLANHTTARWVSVFGNIDGTPASVTVFSHPSNFRYPQKIRVHPTMPYWVFTPVVDQGFFIPPGGSYKASYKYYVCDKKPDEQTLQQIHELFEKQSAN